MVFGRVAAENADASILGEKLIFPNGRVANNRFLKGAMTERISSYTSDISKRGFPNQNIINMYEKWGSGGFGVVLTGNIATHPTHLEAAGNAILAKENDCPELREWYTKWATAAKMDGALAVAQTTNAGRQTPEAVEPHPFSASDVHLIDPFGFNKCGKPIALSIEQIKTEVIDRFVYASKALFECGFDGVQFHGAHGYLLSQFLSPTTNKRTDNYGGSLANRVRIYEEVYKAVREALPRSTGFVIGVKVNSVEFQNEGLDTNDAVEAAQHLENVGYDFVEITGGCMEKWAFYTKESTRKREAYFLEFADKMRPVFKNTVVYVTGGFRTVAGMVNAVKSNSTQGIGLGRPVASEPDLPKKILAGSVQSAPVVQVPDLQTSFLSVVAANSQMYDMSRKSISQVSSPSEGIVDLSNPVEVENYVKEATKYVEDVMSKAGKQVTPGVFVYTPIATKA